MTSLPVRQNDLSLVHNDNIIIRPADKRSGIAVIDKSEYMEKMRKEMEGSKSYMETEGDQTEVAWKKVKKLVNRMHRDGVITKDMKQYLTFVNPKAGSLKGNPKLHKSGVQDYCQWHQHTNRKDGGSGRI